MIAGADGYRGKWVAAVAQDNGSTSVRIVTDIEELLVDGLTSHVVIDVPIGLPERGARACDLAARKMLGARRSSVFPAPIRGVSGASTYREMCDLWFQIEEKRASKQLFGILPLIRDVDRRMTPGQQALVREGHPEVSFTDMSGGEPMPNPKSTISGVLDRIDLIQEYYPDALKNIRDLPEARSAGDALDAYALLWTANRWRDGRARSLPVSPEVDQRGLRMEILY